MHRCSPIFTDAVNNTGLATVTYMNGSAPTVRRYYETWFSAVKLSGFNRGKFSMSARMVLFKRRGKISTTTKRTGSPDRLTTTGKKLPALPHCRKTQKILISSMDSMATAWLPFTPISLPVVLELDFFIIGHRAMGPIGYRNGSGPERPTAGR